MKKYIKNNIIKNANKIVIHNNGVQVLNPSEEMILENGWKPYTELISDEDIINLRKTELKQEIMNYDSSPEINLFYINGQPVWIDKLTRTGLKLRFEAEIAIGKTDTILWYNGIKFPLTLSVAMQMLYAIEIYASECYDNTQRHLSIVDSLETIEDMYNYDYMAGYPEKLQF